ncbi:sensor histidine kinase N-terminal domain-containing protein [Rouxiella badensis]|uniref:ATP-binding protein n=1 Tax=Yersiniaceae TaxID=1903411 RepID=UPI001C27434A|nr:MULTISPECIES: ATP-binding protein [Yersiniaceae]MBU9849171.1 sensor histidine kinase N-terminal domain-containing protein [Rahnella aceris]MBU9858739.1 sensor histidine kinase N-terminal domain-containing protein [Rahnella aceris]MCC3705496.1 sensor histidine kinase N-terminal domain-containing protein [Rouxiella badensis]MCC3735935.1 sensor histidine kinase N-terminal domain-containing protein [Rouxiella badensis]MCC3742571.1 sensor histidine kinase N-terminal domain-containing protein [Ro
MSLRLRAVLITGISLLVLWGAAAGWMMRGVHSNLDRTLDDRLAMSARMVSGLLERAALAPNSADSDFTEAVRISGKEGIACEIRSLQGDILARTTTGPHSEFESLPAEFSTQDVLGHQWRVYVLRANGYQITTADRVDQREMLIDELLSVAGVPFLIAFLGGLAALWIGIGRGLAPLETLSQQLRDKHADDTSAIAVNHSPSELRPVLDAMNGLLKRLARTLASQRAFTDAAAHELRTPLTVIDTHLQVARISEGDEVTSSLSNAEEGVKRLRRTLDQMMTLARAETPADEADVCSSVTASIRSVLDQWKAEEGKRLSLSISGEDIGTPVPKSMLETAVRNLVDNAIRYSPREAAIEVGVFLEPSARRCLITVSDRGPGLTAEQASQIGQRFWRGDQGRKSKDGAGLGISIVRAIAERFGGVLNLEPREGRGLVAKFFVPTDTVPKKS